MDGIRNGSTRTGRCENQNILSVCLQKACTFLPVPAYNTPDWNGADMTVKQIYPVEEAQHVRINQDHTITVEYEQPVMARVFEVTI